MSSQTLEQMRQENPKAMMVLDYITKHYPDDAEEIATHRMIPSMIASPNYTPDAIGKMIDKLAIFNNWQKWDRVKL